MPQLPELPYYIESLILLVAVILVKTLLQNILPHQPLQGFAFFCKQLAAKVNKTENSQRQQQISGIVAVLVTFVPLWIIIWLFGDFVEVTWLWQGLLLYLALGSCTLSSTAKQIAQAVVANNNYQAKQLLNPYVLRETDKLSAMGINKATIEMLVVRQMQEYFTIVLLFLSGGALVALSYRLLLTMHYSWNIKRKQFQYFGHFANLLIQLIQWLPIRLFTIAGLLLTLGQNSTLYWRLTMSDFFKLNTNIIIKFFALTSNIKLAGVAIYDDSKLRRTSFNDNGQQPNPQDIIHVKDFIFRIYFLFAIVIIALAIARIVLAQ